MKSICPHCHSSAVYEMSIVTSNNLIEEMLSPTVLVSLSVSLCKSLKVHPVIGVIAGTVVATVIQLTQSNNTLSMLVNKQYCCSNCSHVFN